MSNDTKTCFFCGKDESRYQEGLFNFPDIYQYHCNRCGQYRLLRDMVQKESSSLPKGDRFKIACLLQEKHKHDEKITRGIFPDDWADTPADICEQTDRWWTVSQILSEFPGPSEILDRALLNLSKQVQNHPMESIVIENDRLPFLLFTPKSSSARTFQYIKNKAYFVESKDQSGALRLSITPEGWNRIEQLSEVNSESTQGFVAMWFNESTDSIYKDGIRKGIKAAGFKPKCMNTAEHNNKICDEIIAEIRKSRFVVADFTAGKCEHCELCDKAKDCKDQVRPRGGVYFEAGFALGLGIPVIWTVHESQIDQVHFDTRQYNHIVYANAEELRTKLYNRIVATIGQGPVNGDA